MPKKTFFKMLGGYPTAFFMAKKTFFTMLGGYPPAFLNAQKDILKNAWWVSNSLFYV
jgi:hypothetical protein